jgi:3-deoxy-D-manno-octulosonate 8-phosphate phosphatase (KDO 8-P phosphatase)
MASSKPSRRRNLSRSQTVSPRAWARIRLLALDVDGILTDGTIYVSSDGSETKGFSVLDGMGMARLLKAGIAVAWISGRPSGATVRRAEELRIPHVIQGRSDKREALAELAQRLGLDASDCCYMGDDDIDAPAIAWAGIGATVRSAMPAALEVADYVTQRPAGAGAVREVCDFILTQSRPAPRPRAARP